MDYLEAMRHVWNGAQVQREWWDKDNYLQQKGATMQIIMIRQGE